MINQILAKLQVEIELKQKELFEETKRQYPIGTVIKFTPQSNSGYHTRVVEGKIEGCIAISLRLPNLGFDNLFPLLFARLFPRPCQHPFPMFDGLYDANFLKVVEREGKTGRVTFLALLNPLITDHEIISYPQSGVKIPIVAFENTRKDKDTSPDYRIFKSKPKEA